MKRFFDILFSISGLIICIPLFALVAVSIKLDSRGSVFFSHKRVGRNFEQFNLYKFRTMIADAPALGPAVTAGGDSRITRVGRFLRKTKIDELPQLLNILKGDMSLVGPRPEVVKYVEIFNEDYREILTIRPGITDYSAIEFRDEEDILRKYDDPEAGYIREILPAKIRLYRRYLKERNFIVDLKLIFLTLYRILK